MRTPTRPTAGSVVLAGVLLKMGTYGFLRFAIPIFPQAAVDLAPILLVLAVIGITYGAIVAAMQPNLKRIIAYSSIAHLGFVVLGVFAFTNQGISGGLFTMLSHGLTTGALFLLVGMLYDRRHTYELADLRGLWKAAPVFGGLFVAATFASIGLPGFSGFVGEFLSLLGAFLTQPLVRGGRDRGRDPRGRLPVVGGAARVHRRTRRGERRRRPRSGSASCAPWCRCSVCRCSSASTRSRCSTGCEPSVRTLVAQIDVAQRLRAARRQQAVHDRRGPHRLPGGGGREVIGAALPSATPIPAPSIDWFAIAPEIALFGAALIIVLLRSLVRHDPRVHERRR